MELSTEVLNTVVCINTVSRLGTVTMDHVERLFINLKIIASVQPFQKLNTKGGEHLVIETGTWTPSVMRWLREDGRMNTVKRISEILNEADRTLHLDSTEEEAVTRLRAQLRCTEQGLSNLRQTYETDPTTTAHFDVLIEKVGRLAPHLETSRSPNPNKPIRAINVAPSI